MEINRRRLLNASFPAIALGSFSKPSNAQTNLAKATLSVREFGAKCDGLSDDTAALQRAIDACQKTGHESSMPDLLIEGACRIQNSVFIDRPVDQTRGVFRLRGQGTFGGFLVAGNFPLFDSRLTHPSAPVSEYICFDNVRFEALANARRASSMSDKFLRVQFHNCEFHTIRALISDKYAQEWQFSRCIVRYWSEQFFSSGGGYLITSTGSKYQNGGGTAFQISDAKLGQSGCVGCSFHQDSAESNSGSFLKASIVRGLSVSGLYSEGNSGATIDLDNDAPNRGVSVTGCMFAPQQRNIRDEAFFDIAWGKIEGGRGGGNYSTGRLHHYRSIRADTLDVANDFAEVELVKHSQ